MTIGLKYTAHTARNTHGWGTVRGTRPDEHIVISEGHLRHQDCLIEKYLVPAERFTPFIGLRHRIGHFCS
ncbi:MAG: hypothetical protein M3Q16_00890 [Pseudomonadota bacterium]|nr:hypothetical protein [Pseudomonadota bacterium]